MTHDLSDADDSAEVEYQEGAYPVYIEYDDGSGGMRFTEDEMDGLVEWWLSERVKDEMGLVVDLPITITLSAEEASVE